MKVVYGNCKLFDKVNCQNYFSPCIILTYTGYTTVMPFNKWSLMITAVSVKTLEELKQNWLIQKNISCPAKKSENYRGLAKSRGCQENITIDKLAILY